MRLTDLALLWIIITCPIQIMLDWRLHQISRDEQAMTLIERSLQAATDDASYVMAQSTVIDHPQIAKQFFRSLSQLLHGSVLLRSKSHIPLLLIIEQDGYYTYSPNGIDATERPHSTRHFLQPKRFFTAADRQGNSYHLTMSEQLKMYSKQQNRWLDGNRDDLFAQTGASVLSTELVFEQWKRSMMMEQLERDLQLAVGGTFTFVFPRSHQSGMADAEFGNIIDGIGLITCLRAEGTGLGGNTLYALATSELRIDKKSLSGNE